MKETYVFIASLLSIQWTQASKSRPLKGIGESNFFFTKNKIGSCMRALNTNYKQVFIE